MARLESAIDRRSAEFQANARAMQAQLGVLREKLAAASLGGSAEARERHAARGKLFVRDRIELLLDPGSPFLEIGALAANGLYGGDAHSAGLVAGIGRVSGRECMIAANDATIKGGTYYPLTVKKHLRAQDIARENRLPCLYMVDSGGAFLPQQDEIFPDERHFGRIFYNQAQMSAAGIPQIAIVMGPCTAGGAYVPAMCDESIIVKGNGTIFLGGPPLVRAATGEIVTAEELGGADVHSRQSGVTDHFAQSDAHAIGIARGIVADLNRVKPASLDVALPRDPLYPAEDLYGIVQADVKKPYDVREAIARIVDGSEFDEFKKLYGHDARLRHGAYLGLPCRHPRQQRHPVLGKRAEGRAFHRDHGPARHPAGLPAEHHGLHGRQEIRGGRHRQGRREARHRRRHRERSEIHRRDRRLLRRGQLRHVRARLRPSLPVDVAEREDLRHGRRAGRHRSRHRAARSAGGQGRRLEQRGGGGVQGAGSRAIRGHRPTPIMRPPGFGTTASSILPIRAWFSRSRFPQG